MNIFFIHSHITYLASISATHEMELTDTVFIFHKKYLIPDIPDQTKRIITPDWLDHLFQAPTYGSNKPIKDLILLRKLDNWVNEICGSKSFKLFIPHSRSLLFHFLLTHKRCTELNYIDEGMMSYTDTFHKKSKSDIGKLRRFIYGNRINYFRNHPVNYNHQYLFICDDNISVDPDSVVKLSWPKIHYETGINLKGKIILSLNNFDKFSLYSEKELKDFLTYLFSFYNGQPLVVKFHPREKHSEMIKGILESNGFKYEILPDNLVLELAILNGEVNTVAGIWSSLLFYSSSMGIPTESHLNKFIRINDKTGPWIESLLPQVFYEGKIKFL